MNSPDLKVFFQNNFQRVQKPHRILPDDPAYILLVRCTMSVSSEIFCKLLFNKEQANAKSLFFYNIFHIAQGIQNLNITWVADKINILLHTDPDQQSKMLSKNLKQESCPRQRNSSTYHCVHLEHSREGKPRPAPQPTLMHLELEKSGSHIRTVKWFSYLELERKT